MANKYLYSGAAGTANGFDWTNAYTTITAAIAGMATTDDLWVASDHSETTASALTLTLPGTAANPNRILSVSRAGSVPPVAADLTPGGSVATTGASAITFSGIFYAYGLTVSAGDGSSTANVQTASSGGARWEKSSFVIGNTSTSSRVISSATAGSYTEWNDCTVTFGNASQGIQAASGQLLWRNGTTTAVQGATLPSTLLLSLTNGVSHRLVDLDFSNLTSKILCASTISGGVKVINCRCPATFTILASTSANPTPYWGGFTLQGCGSSANVSRNESWQYQATLTTETTIKRTAGASDGTTAYCWKIVSTANAKRYSPFESFEGALWNSTTGASKTLTVHCVTDNVTLQDIDLWLEVEYLGSSSTPQSTQVSSGTATVLTTGTNLTSDSGETWTTTGLTTPVKQKMSVTFTPQMAGPIRWRVKMAKTSTTVYVCPKADLA